MKQPENDMALTAREIEVLELLRAGQRNAAIAAALCISEHTVETHLRHIYHKLGARSRTEALWRWAEAARGA